MPCTNFWYTLYVNRVISQIIGSHAKPQQYCSYFAQSNATLVRQSCERLIGNHAQIKTLKYTNIYCALVRQRRQYELIIFFKQLFFCSCI